MKDKYSVGGMDKYTASMATPGFKEPKKEEEPEEELGNPIGCIVIIVVFLALVGGIFYLSYASGQAARRGPWPAKYEVGQLVTVDDNPLVFEITDVWWQHDSECSQYMYSMTRASNGRLYTSTYCEYRLRLHP